MRYDSIELDPVPGFGWVVRHHQVHGDREPRKDYTPNALGFFHYPRKWGIGRGFAVLKKTMIERHEAEIARLEKSLAALRAAELPDEIAGGWHAAK